MILKPLQKIEVVESKKKWKPGSLGYFVCQTGFNNYNSWDMCIVFTRFGKKGMHRLELAIINTLMIEYDQLEEKDRKIMDIIKFVEQLEPRVYQSMSVKGRHQPKYSPKIVGETTIKPISTEHKDLLNMDIWDFMAYITALSLYAYKLSVNKEATHIIQAPLLQMNLFKQSNMDLSTITPVWIGYYILRGLWEDSQKKETTFKHAYIHFFDDMNNRRQCLERLILVISQCKERSIQYSAQVVARYTRLESVFNEALSYYRRRKKDLKEIEKEEKETGTNPYMNVRSRIKPNVKKKEKKSIYHTSTAYKQIYGIRHTPEHAEDEPVEVVEDGLEGTGLDISDWVVNVTPPPDRR